MTGETQPAVSDAVPAKSFSQTKIRSFFMQHGRNQNSVLVEGTPPRTEVLSGSSCPLVSTKDLIMDTSTTEMSTKKRFAATAFSAESPVGKVPRVDMIQRSKGQTSIHTPSSASGGSIRDEEASPGIVSKDCADAGLVQSFGIEGGASQEELSCLDSVIGHQHMPDNTVQTIEEAAVAGKMSPEVTINGCPLISSIMHSFPSPQNAPVADSDSEGFSSDASPVKLPCNNGSKVNELYSDDKPDGLSKTQHCKVHNGGALTMLKSSKGRRIPALPEPPEAIMTDYEREREENIRRNALIMEKLGISGAKESLEKVVSVRKQVCKPRNKVSNLTPAPLRRSLRKQGISPADLSAEELKGEKNEESREECDAELEEVMYDDSSVVKYKCGGHLGDGVIPMTSSMNWSDLGGFCLMPNTFLDHNLTRIYTMDFAPIADRRTALLAAGGHNGRIAVFGIESGMCVRPSTETKEVEAAGPIVSSKEESPDEACEPLLSWKGSSGWISQVHFLSQQPQGATLLLSSSNDGSIVIWDLNKQQATPKVHNGRAGRALQVGMPRIVTERQSLHSNGIFAMHELDGQIVTGSKDCSVALSVVKDAGISKERVIEGHHMGAIRGVRFREPNIVADCGADGQICILDLRLRDPCTLTIATTQSNMNVVEWSPSQGNLLLSASNDPEILVYDIRSHGNPLHRLGGHVKPGLRRCSRIYRPTFIGDGSSIATSGEGSKMLSLYSMSTGKAISRGYIGCDATTLLGSNRTSGSRSQLWAACKHIVQFAPTSAHIQADGCSVMKS